MAHEIHHGMYPQDEYLLPHTGLADPNHRMGVNRENSVANNVMTVTHAPQKRPSTSPLDVRDVKKHRPKSLNFVCTVVNCGEKFSSSEQLDTHMKLHIGVKPFTCEVCGKVCQTESKLKAHQASHATDGIKPVCDICERNFSSRSALNKHKKMLHKPKPHVCPHCSAGFEERKYMVIHAKRAHDIDVPLAEDEEQSASATGFDINNFETNVNSSDCKDLYKRNYSMPVETNSVHGSGHPSNSIDMQKDHALHSQTEGATISKKVEMNSQAVCALIACDLCTSTFPSVAYLEQHMAVHIGEKNFTCQVCGMSFTGRHDLSSHMRLHAPDNDCTNFGSYNNGHFSQFTSHQMQPGQSRSSQVFYRYACAVCNEQFLNLGSLKRHQAKGHNTAVLSI